MRFLVDECTGPAVAAWLKDEGHDVYSVYDESPGTKDAEIIRRAVDERSAEKIAVLSRLLERFPGELAGRIVVVTTRQVRFAAQ
jgi:hypothetical protein